MDLETIRLLSNETLDLTVIYCLKVIVQVSDNGKVENESTN